jgi:hypothetical protein
MKSEWAWLALVKDISALANQVKPIGPAGVSGLDSIIESIYECWKLDAKLTNAGACDKCALNLILRATEENVVAHIGLHLPNVGGMRLENVDGVKPDFVAILFGQLVQGGNLPPKRRSCIAAKNQDYRPVGPE